MTLRPSPTSRTLRVLSRNTSGPLEFLRTGGYLFRQHLYSVTRLSVQHLARASFSAGTRRLSKNSYCMIGWKPLWPLPCIFFYSVLRLSCRCDAQKSMWISFSLFKFGTLRCNSELCVCLWTTGMVDRYLELHDCVIIWAG